MCARLEILLLVLSGILCLFPAEAAFVPVNCTSSQAEQCLKVLAAAGDIWRTNPPFIEKAMICLDVESNCTKELRTCYVGDLTEIDRLCRVVIEEYNECLITTPPSINSTAETSDTATNPTVPTTAESATAAIPTTETTIAPTTTAETTTTPTTTTPTTTTTTTTTETTTTPTTTTPTTTTTTTTTETTTTPTTTTPTTTTTTTTTETTTTPTTTTPTTTTTTTATTTTTTPTTTTTTTTTQAPDVYQFKNYFSPECKQALIAQGKFEECYNIFDAILVYANSNHIYIQDQEYVCRLITQVYEYRTIWDILKQVCGNAEVNRISGLIQQVKLTYRCT